MKCELDENGKCRHCDRSVMIPPGIDPSRVLRECISRPATFLVSTKDLPCIHRGTVLQRLKCSECDSGGRNTAVYACMAHGECTLVNLIARRADGSRWPACNTCEDRNKGGSDTR